MELGEAKKLGRENNENLSLEYSLQIIAGNEKVWNAKHYTT